MKEDELPSNPQEQQEALQSVDCKICGDKASGFHYGVHACEGCKGFFRRTLRMRLQYEYCDRNCTIKKKNRNKCQFCRFNKCLSLGMSHNAIRFGRIPEAEKKRLVQSPSADAGAIDSSLSESVVLSQKIHSSYINTFSMTKKKARDILTGRSSISPFVIHDMDTLWQAEQGILWEQLPMQDPPRTEIGVHVFYRCQCTSVETVLALTNFAKSIPGFNTLYLNDQVTLLKYGVHEAIFCMLASLMNKDGLLVAEGRGFVTHRPGLVNPSHVEDIQEGILSALRSHLNTSHSETPFLFPKLLHKMADLRQLVTEHAELVQSIKRTETSASLHPLLQEIYRDMY